MSENITFTRISDLPENGYGNPPAQNQMMPPQQQQQQPANYGPNTGQNQMVMQLPPSTPLTNGQNTGFDQNTYQPMNIHPNPYGFPSPPPGGLPLPQQQMKPNQQMQNELYMGNGNSVVSGSGSGSGIGIGSGVDRFTGGSQQLLPSRDIPFDTTTYMQDEKIQANYIPPPSKKQTSDYILDYEETSAKNIQQYEKEKRKKRVLESWFDEIHIPVLITILYFIFQLPIVNTLFFRRFAFLSIYDTDGQFNLTGLLLKSILFGGSFYSVRKVVDVLSEM
jgi:hypothetical protein